MGILDSNKITSDIRTGVEEINSFISRSKSGELSLDLSSTGNKGSIDVSSMNGMFVDVRFSSSNGNARICLAPISAYFTPVYTYNVTGAITNQISASGRYWIDTTSINTLYVYCSSAESGVTATLYYYTADNAPVLISSVKPIQLIFEKSFATTSSTSQYRADNILGFDAFKYIYFVIAYGKDGVLSNATYKVWARDKITGTDGNYFVDKDILEVSNESTYKSGYLENNFHFANNSGLSLFVRFESTPVDGANLYLKIYGVR